MATRGDQIMLERINPEKNGENKRKAAEAVTKGLVQEAEEIDLDIPETHRLEGARLESMTQNLAYKHILKKKRIDPLTKTGKEALARAMSKAKDAGVKIKERDIWTGLKGPPNMKGNIADFLWRILQGKLKIGKY